MQILNKPIEMIAQFNRDGSIKPIRFRINIEDGELKIIPVKAVKYIYDDKREKTKKFTCIIELNDVQRICDIVYKMESMEWVLYRI